MNTIEIKIPYFEKRKQCEKTFEISITPNKFNVDYSEYMKYAGKLIDLNNEAKTADHPRLLEIQEEIEKYDLVSLLEKKYSLVKTMMKANGYEYDHDFWDIMVDPADVNRFITDCSLKDSDFFPKKKAVKM